MADVSYAVDVSGNQPSHQPWKSFGIHMGIAKASEGQHSRDPWFVRHIADIKSGGLVPGGYHFAWPNQDAHAEAENYAAAVRPVLAPDFVHALDLERYPNGGKNYAGRAAAQIRQYAHDWIAAVKAAFPGQKVGIYTSGADIAAGHLPGNQDFLWYPAYPVQGRSFAQAVAASRPAPSGHPVWGWQFTSVPRDQTVIYMSPAALRTWAAGTTPTVQEDDVELTPAQITAIGQEAAHQTWIYPWQSPTDPKGKPRMMGTFLAYNDAQTAALKSAITAGQEATVKALAPLIGSGVDTDRVIAALKDMVVHVTVTGIPETDPAGSDDPAGS